MSVRDRIGFMQGRLSPPVAGRIQAFPWADWPAEFPAAARAGFGLMEWTLDQERLHENPLMTEAGRASIGELERRHRLRIPSLTGDCFMQAPFWKARGEERESRQRDFQAVIDACALAGVGVVVVPLVDHGSLQGREEREILLEFMRGRSTDFARQGVRIAFESDWGPGELAGFIADLAPAGFGVNYDIGNSASLGFDPEEELDAYGPRIINVHVKDRPRGGATVPLGAGAADFSAVFAGLGRLGYDGNYILQTARAADQDHAGALGRYRDLAAGWLTSHDQRILG